MNFRTSHLTEPPSYVGTTVCFAPLLYLKDTMETGILQGAEWWKIR